MSIRIVFNPLELEIDIITWAVVV